MRRIARVSWGYSMDNGKRGSRIRREKLPVDFKFRLNRDLGKIKRPVVRYQEEIKSQMEIRNQVTQKPAVRA